MFILFKAIQRNKQKNNKKKTSIYFLSGRFQQTLGPPSLTVAKTRVPEMSSLLNITKVKCGKMNLKQTEMEVTHEESGYGAGAMDTEMTSAGVCNFLQS